MAFAVTLDNFKEYVLQEDRLVLIDFWADWCGPCRSIAPLIDQLEEDYEGRIVLAKINVDEQQELAEQFRVSSIPTVLLMKKGIVAERFVGAHCLAEYKETIDGYFDLSN